MRYYSIIDNFVEAGSVNIPIDEHASTNQLGSTWLSFVDPLAVIRPRLDSVVFNSTQSAARTVFDSAGFENLFQIRLTLKFSRDPLSAGQFQNFIIVDENDDGYILQVSTDAGDNSLLTYEVQEYNSGILTPFGFTDTITTPDGLFNIFLSVGNGLIKMKLDLEAELLDTIATSYAYSEFKFQGEEPTSNNQCNLKRFVLLGDLVDPIFAEQYTDLIIKQYHEKPKAFGEIQMKAKSWSRTYSIIGEVPEEFDPDFAFGKQLDVVSKQVFGFVIRSVNGQTLTDEKMRDLIKVKIAKNNASSFMVSDDRISIQEVIQLLFNGNAYVVDNYDMALTLYIDNNVDTTFLGIVQQLGLLPAGQGVRYRSIVQYNDVDTFGFPSNVNSKTWNDKFTPATDPGVFAQKVI